MGPTEAPYTVLTLGALNLVDGENYSLVEGGWSPQVAARRRSVLVNRSPYEDVVEEIVVNVHAQTGAAALENLHALSAVLDRAERWAEGENVEPVLLVCQPQGSELDEPLSTLVLGRAGDAPLMGLPVTFNDDLMIWEIRNVTLRFRRRGQWLGAAVTTTAEAADVPGVLDVVFDDLPTPRLPAVLTVKLDGLQELPSGAFPASTLLVTGGSLVGSVIQLIEGEALTGTGWSSVADTTNLARGGAVGRLTASGTSQVTMSGVFSMQAGPVGIWGVFRSNTAASASWRVSVELRNQTTRSNGTTRETYIPADNNADPRVIYLGSIYAAQQSNAFRLYITPSVAAATLDLDCIAFLSLNDASAAAISLDADVGTATIKDVAIDARALSDPAPRAMATYDGSPDGYSIGARGPLWLTDSPDFAGIYAVWLATNGAKWRLDNGSGTVVTTSLSVTRYPVYLVPQ